MNFKLQNLALTVSLLLSVSFSFAKSKYEFEKFYGSLPFAMDRVERPSIPSRTVLLTDFGAKNDGVSLNTRAFSEAIAHLSSKGGGHLVVPAGVWRTGPIELKSHIDLHLEYGAVILFDPDRSLYPIINVSFEGLDTRRCTSPLSAVGAEDVSITGSGVIDGSGDSWRAVKKSKLTSSQWKAKLASGGVLNEKKDCWYPDEGYMLAEKTANMNVPSAELDENYIKSFLRPVMVSLRSCSRVLLEGCTFQNSPAWNIHPLQCDKLIVKDITVRNPAWSQNGDGIDIESCTNTLLIDSSFDCGDDAICIKSGKDEDGRRRAAPTKGLIVSGCTVYHGHGGFVVGSEMSGGVSDVKVSDCRFLGTDVGLRFKSKRGRGGVVENIWIERITMTDIVTDAVLFDLYYGGKSAVEQKNAGEQTTPTPAVPVDETTPAFRHIHISDIVCAGADRAMYFNGLPEMPIQGIELSSCNISSRRGAEIRYSEDIRLEKLSLDVAEGPVLKTECVNGIVTDFPLSVLTVSAEMSRHPKATFIDGLQGKFKWNYTTGLELLSFLDVYERYGGRNILNYVDEWYDGIIDEDGKILTYKLSNYSTDHVCPARTLFKLYDLTGKEKYLKAAKLVRSQLDTHPRTEQGGFYHKAIYPHQMWLDGIYMAQPFYAESTSRSDASQAVKELHYRDICNHFLVVAEHTFDPATGLYRHAWDESHSMPWADSLSGQSQHAWGRALGWYCMAVTETMPFIPEGTPGRDRVLEIFRGIMETLPKYADPESGMWYQVLDRPGSEGNYVESTASAMFCMAMLKGIRLGYLPGSLKQYASQTYEKLLKSFVVTDSDGRVSLTSCCAVAGLGGKQNRMGDYTYYINEKVCDNDPKGIGPLVWAALEVESK